jgi:putative MFS transporter
MSVASTRAVLRPVDDSGEIQWQPIIAVLLVAGLGFFVDVYDIVLFMLVRIPSLISLGLSEKESLHTGIMVLNLQMAGMMIGGLAWGVLGDKKGRRSVLFGSILLYSVATLLNGFATTVPVYAALRFLTGMGLAGEVGAAMTIAAEVMPARYRGYGTGAIAGFAVLGAIAASVVSNVLPWRITYITAGFAGLLLLLLRMSMKETDLFRKAQSMPAAERGSLLLLCDRRRLLRLLRCMLAGAPNWFVIGILVTFAPEICSSTGHGALVNVSGVLICYCIGEATGEVVCGMVTQLLHSRRKAIGLFVFCSFITAMLMLHCSAQAYQWLCIPAGIFGGFWGVVVTSASEQFGTNMRSTTTTLTPNLIRSTTIPMTLLFGSLVATFGASTSALLTGLLCYACSAIALLFMEETFAKDLDFVESNGYQPILAKKPIGQCKKNQADLLVQDAN